MSKSRVVKYRIVVLILTLVLLGQTLPASAQTEVPFTPATGEAPAGFRLIDSAPGVELYRKDYANGSPDFVQVLHLDLGAKVQLLHGRITEPRPEKGSYGGPDPRMTSLPIQTYWNQIAAENELAFCAINGSFFYMPEYPTRLAFPLKVDDQIVTEGWGIQTYLDQKLVLELWDGQADIQPLSKESLYASSAPNILGGLTEEANKRAKYAVGRTFVGVDDRDEDGAFEKLLFLTTRVAKQTGAASVLREFGADKVMMLDGGGSTQLYCKSGHFIRSDRPLPQALGIFAAEPAIVSAKVIRTPSWTVIRPGERLFYEFEIRNTGIFSWTVQDSRFFLSPSQSGIAEWLPVEVEIGAGSTAVLRDTLLAIDEPGVHVIDIAWGVRTRGESYQGPPVQALTVVLPPEFEAHRQTLVNQLKQWKDLPPEEVKSLVDDWFVRLQPTTSPTATPLPVSIQSPPPTTQVMPTDMLLIPLLMLPIMIILAVIIGKRNFSS